MITNELEIDWQSVLQSHVLYTIFCLAGFSQSIESIDIFNIFSFRSRAFRCDEYHNRISFYIMHMENKNTFPYNIQNYVLFTFNQSSCYTRRRGRYCQVLKIKCLFEVYHPIIGKVFVVYTKMIYVLNT